MTKKYINYIELTKVLGLFIKDEKPFGDKEKDVYLTLEPHVERMKEYIRNQKVNISCKGNSFPRVDGAHIADYCFEVMCARFHLYEIDLVQFRLLFTQFSSKAILNEKMLAKNDIHLQQKLFVGHP